MTCRSTECYNRHKEASKYKNGKDKGKVSGPSECKKWWKCPTCYKVLNIEKRKREEHRCGEYFCSSCKEFVLDDHLCYLRSIPAEEDFVPKFIFFDFECSQDELMECEKGYQMSRKKNCKNCQEDNPCRPCAKCKNCKTSSCGKATHTPNYVVAHTVCPRCIDTELTPKSVCRACGTRCEECEYEGEDKDEGPCPGTCGLRETIFQGDATAKKFGAWVFSQQHKYFKCVAHNMKGYDGYFLLEYLIDNAMRPDKIIYTGSKIMYMTVEKDLHIKVIDSLNFLPMKLSALPKAFGLKELKKGWFPHFFNTRENQNYVGLYPEPKYYGHEFMSSKERDEFLTWHDQNKDKEFDFRKEMYEYCRSDVDILRQSCLKFRHLLMSSTGVQVESIDENGKKQTKWVGAVDPFNSVTIASVCMNTYRTKFLEEETRVQLDNGKKWLRAKEIGGKQTVLLDGEWVDAKHIDRKVTASKFHSTPIAKIPTRGYKDQYSKSSIEWLEWVASQNGINIQHALNIGEKSLPGTRYKLDGFCQETNTAYEYHGCVFHGCKTCFPVDREETFHPMTNQSMTELYALTQKKKFHIENKLGMKYICIWEHEFLKERNQNEQLRQFLKNLDVSDRLDPRDSFFGGRTNASQLYYKTQDREQIKYVDFTSLYPWVNKYCEYPVGHPEIITSKFKNLNEYFGIAKVKILPPRGLYHPVIPYRSNGKLKFPLCRTCADAENQLPCNCTEDERSITGTWCIPEIQTAIRLGYEIIKIYEVYHWNETTKYDPDTHEGGLFAEYIDTFLKFKQEASGPPDWIKTTGDEDKYIRDYLEKEGVTLNKENINKNPGLRALAKLCLNSFWGKFGQRLNMRQTNFYNELEVDEFFQTIADQTKEVQNFHIVADDTIQVEWTYKKDCTPEDNKTNIYLATFTTCWARLKLYSVLEELDRRVLYYDTDSVIYVSQPGEYDPPLGDYLGELTDELDVGEYITEFVSGGPKNYSYKTSTNNETCKVRGFTLNFTNSKLINFDTVKEIVTDANSRSTIVVNNPRKICRDKRKRKLYNREEDKTYRMVYTKRRRLENYDTVPYGF